jgi:hypothetical protein
MAGSEAISLDIKDVVCLVKYSVAHSLLVKIRCVCDLKISIQVYPVLNSEPLILEYLDFAREFKTYKNNIFSSFFGSM